jgi:hypothetical protein
VAERGCSGHIVDDLHGRFSGAEAGAEAAGYSSLNIAIKRLFIA